MNLTDDITVQNVAWEVGTAMEVKNISNGDGPPGQRRSRSLGQSNCQILPRSTSNTSCKISGPTWGDDWLSSTSALFDSMCDDQVDAMPG